jgi:hypothetical protein
MNTTLPEQRRARITLDGSEAAASVAHRVSEVIAIYPITPSSTIGEEESVIALPYDRFLKQAAEDTQKRYSVYQQLAGITVPLPERRTVSISSLRGDAPALSTTYLGMSLPHPMMDPSCSDSSRSPISPPSPGRSASVAEVPMVSHMDSRAHLAKLRPGRGIVRYRCWKT